MSCPTIKIDDGNGSFIIINQSDFDPKKQKEFSVKKAPKKSKAK